MDYTSILAQGREGTIYVQSQMFLMVILKSTSKNFSMWLVLIHNAMYPSMDLADLPILKLPEADF